MFCRPIPRTPWALLAFVSLVSPSPASGEVKPGEKMEQPFHVKHWTVEDGLPQNRISALAQTPDGYLWVGTWFGLARFDAVRFTVFNEFNTPAMTNQTINALAVDTEGSLWIGTANGLLRYRDREFTRISLGEGLQNPRIWRLWPSRSGGVWIQVAISGLDKFLLWSDGLPVVATELNLDATQSLLSLRENEDGNLTVTTSHGFVEITRKGEVRKQPAPPGAPAFPWGGDWRQKDGQCWWISTPYDLWLWRNGAWQSFERGNSHSDLGHFMYEDRTGRLWVNRGDAAGILRATGDSVEATKLGDHGVEKSVGCMLEDAEGHVWFGTAHGLFQLKPTLIRAVTTENGLPHNECWSVCEAPDGAIWVETLRGAARIQDEHAQTFPDEPGRSPCRSIFADRTGRLWLGNGRSGLIVWRPGAEERRIWHAKPTMIESLYLARDGRMWVGTDHGVTWFENGQPVADWGQFGLPTNGVRSIYQTRDGTMWFGTWKAGAVKWKTFGVPPSGSGTSADIAASETSSASPAKAGTSNEITRYTTANGLADDRVFVFHEDAEGALWIGTHNGLSRFKDGQFFTFRTEHGLLDDLINWLEEDDFGRLWFSCNRGIVRIERQELNAVADGRKARANVAVYGTADGMPSPETNGEHQPAGCKDREGRLWFPTQLGVVMIDPKMVAVSEVPPPVVIEQVIADDQVIYGDGPDQSRPGFQRVSSTGIPPRRSNLAAGSRGNSQAETLALRLPPGRARMLQIRYTANSFADPRRVRFRYRLAGSDSDWREDTEERVAYYTNLRPGRYEFEVKAANSHGIWNETPAMFSFSVAPHLWETWPFYGLCIAGVVGLAAGVQTYRLRWQRRLLKLEEQRAVAIERTRIARDLHDDLGTALTGLALELDVIGRESSSRPPLTERLDKTAQHTRELAERMREVVWTVNPACDTVSSLASFLEHQVSQFLRMDGINVRLDFPEDIPALPLGAEARHQLALSVREALSNIVRHAKATEVLVSLAIEGQTLMVRVKDNGCGFRPLTENSHGLGNMRARLERIGGSFECVSAPGAGTEVCFRVPIQAAARSDGGAV